MPVRFEIDINEGHFPCEIATNIHRWFGKHVPSSRRFKLDNDPKYSVASAQSDSRGKKIDLSRDFHVYGLEWNERELVYYFDGKELRRALNEFCHGETPVWLSSAIITLGRAGHRRHRRHEHGRGLRSRLPASEVKRNSCELDSRAARLN